MKKEKEQPIEMRLGEYVFRLGKFKYHASLSRETSCFEADLYVNGQKISFCSNLGCGGSTDVNVLPECRTLAGILSRYLASLPKVQCKSLDFEMELTLDYVVDTLVGKMLKAKDLSRIMNMTSKKLVFQDTCGKYYQIGWRGYDIAGLLIHKQYRQTIQHVILRETSKGNALINENIPPELLPVGKQENKPSK